MSFLSRLGRVFGQGETTEKKSFRLTDPEAHQLFGGIPSASGVQISPHGAMRVPAVRLAVTKIAGEIATIPFKIYHDDPRGAAKDHPAYVLVHDWASDFKSAEALREQVTTDALLFGHGYALVRRNSEGKPIFLARIAPSLVKVKYDVYGEPTYFIRLDGKNETVHGPQDVLHVSCPGGVSPIQHAREAIALCAAAESHLAGFYRNGGRPSGVIKHPNKLEDETIKKISTSWFNTHSGEQAGKTAILDEGMEFQEIALKLADAEFSEVRREQIREIARAFGVPPAILFETSRATWSNYEQSRRDFIDSTLRPWFAAWAAAYTRCLVNLEDRKDYVIEEVVDGLAGADLAARTTAFSQLRAMGAWTANDVRHALNKPPLPGGDELANPFTTSGGTTAPASKPQEENPDE